MYNPLKDKNIMWACVGLNTGIFFFAIALNSTNLICLSLASLGLCFLGTLNTKDDSQDN